MDHAYISEHGLIDRYRRGLLDPLEEARFEEHFTGCAECTEELRVARSFSLGMQAMAMEDTLAAGILAWLARRGRLVQAGLALLLLIGLAAPAAWFAVRGERAADTVAAYRQQLEDARRRETALGGKLAASEAERLKREAQLAQATSAPPAPHGWQEPLVNTPVLLLRTFRDEPGAPPPTSKAGAPLTLAVDAPADPRFTSYRVRLTGAGGKLLFAQGNLHPNALEALMVTFPPGFFAPGEYRLAVSGIAADGGAVDLGSHRFVVAKPAGRPLR